MAKNAIQKKKRIAHNKSAFDDSLLEGENMLPACIDYVSSIINNMDNFTSVRSYTLNARPSESEINSTPQNRAEINVTPSQNNAENTKILKSKKFGIVRKFPLMEKSQKALKQLRHNRRIPKPRAHLASIPDSPVGNDPVSNKSGIAAEKIKKHVPGNRNLKKNNAALQNKSFDKPLHNAIASGLNKNLRPASNNKSKENTKAPNKNLEPHNVKRNSSSSVDSLQDNVTNDSSNDNTTDSEYEKFVQKNRSFRKKCNKQKISTKKQKVSKQSSRKVSKNTVPQSTSKSLSPKHAAYFSDEASTSSQAYCRKSKRIKVCHKVSYEEKSSPSPNNNSESEADTFCGEIYTRDSSSESDIADNETLINNMHDSQVTDKKNSEDSLISEMYSETDKNNASTTYSSVANELPTISSEYSSFDLCSTDQNDLLISTNSFEQNNPSEDLIVDLSSDNECENAMIPTTALLKKEENYAMTKLNQNESQLHSEDSDIEIVDVVVQKSSEKNIACNIADNRPHCSNDYRNKIAIKTEKVSSPFLVETEKSQNVLSKPKIECKRQEEKDADDKHEAAYITNICKEYNQTRRNSRDNSSEHSLCKDVLHDGTLLNREIKKEICDDDDIIILDSNEVSTSRPFKNFSTSNLSFDQNKKNKDKIDTPDRLVNSIVNNVNRFVECISETDSNSSSCQGFPNLQINKNTNVKSGKCFGTSTGVKKEHPDGHNNSKTVGDNNSMTQKELKLYEVACSNLKTQAEKSGTIDKLLSLKQPNMNNLSGVDVKSVLQKYKNEFETYQEIIQTEATVEATFKLLEARQAEKLLSLKSLLQTCVKNNVCESDNSPNIKKEVDLLFENPGLSNSKTLTNMLEPSFTCAKANSDFEKTHSQGDPSVTRTPDGLLRDFYTPFSTANLVPLSSIPERDIKPNISELQNISESVQKSSTSSQMDTLTFGEKCSVCSKEAVAACQRCAKVFFCSNECGKKYWKDGHENECGK